MDTTITIDLRQLARSLKLPVSQVQAVVELLDDGNTVPFITRYRKDQTGGLDEEQIRAIQARLERLRTLADRKRTILRAIEAQGKLTEQLLEQIRSAGTSKRLEDLYLPFKPRKQQFAATARERGLEPLAREILDADALCADLDQRAANFADPDKQVPSAAEALLGAGHIIAEIFSERADVRQKLRDILTRTGRIETIRIAPEVEGENAPPEGASDKKKSKKAESSEEAKPEEKSADDKPAETPAPETPESTPEPVETPEVTTEPAAEVEAPAAPEAPAAESETPAPEATSEATPAVEVVSGYPPQTEEPKETEQPAAETAATEEAPAEEKTEAEPKAAETAEEAPAEEKPRVVPIPEQKQVSRRAQQRKAAEIKKIKSFADYFEYSETLTKIPPHRVLAINRGEREKILRVKLVYEIEAMQAAIEEILVPAEHPHGEYLRGCARDALARLIMPSLERETRRELTDQAETHAVKVFARNLKSLLLQRPVREHRVLAIDPGFRSGCKLAALDQFGNVLGHGVVYLIGRSGKRQQSKRKLLDLIQRFKITVIAIGNGTACRETESFVASMLSEHLPEGEVGYVIVNEAGASVYSTSPIGREEFPSYDATLRGAISIGRRLLDPLSELVKIDPASIGVGLYQHDVKGKHLRASLENVVESSVNHVGVDPNTASTVLLRHVAGLKAVTAQRIFEYRRQNGPFRSRKQLLDVPGIGEATYVQAAGFLKIERGENPLDTTWIHPESYEVTTRLLEKLGLSLDDLRDRKKMATLDELVKEVDLDALAGELEVGRMALDDIIYQLKRPGRDPREELPETVFKKGILKIEDLEVGTELTGTVSNVVDFGAFVDIGLHDSGLVHVSRLADRYVREAHEVVSVGDIVTVWVTAIDMDRRRISLTMIAPGTEKKREQGRRRRRKEGDQGEQGEQPTEGGEAKQGERRRRRPRKEREGQGGGEARKEGEGQQRREGGGRGRGEGGGRQGGRRDGGRRGDRRGRGDGRRPRGPITYEFRAEREETHLTEDVVEGKEPMRSFGELAKLFEIRHGDEVEKARDEGPSKPKRKRRRRGKKQGQGEGQAQTEAKAESTPPADAAPAAEAPAESAPKPETPASDATPPVDTGSQPVDTGSKSADNESKPAEGGDQ